MLRALAILVLTAGAAGAQSAGDMARAAAAQVGVVTIYDPSYVRLSFPGGDVAPERGVCTDVLIRALREGAGIDLQVAVNTDMRRAFSAYPALWGLSRPDRNIDHRRVPNLRRLFERAGAALPTPTDVADFAPGDVVTVTLPGGLAHLMIVTDRPGPEGRPLIAHNIGAGTQVEDLLFAYPMTGVYRLDPSALAALRALAR